ncbi:MAG: flagellin lysine-N-methylase, partial [Caryophanon sp.]|nr:flagellin lysine-N-methylase [Caryophanon sp.]
EYLCHTCATYPRYTQTVDERLEKSMTVSCPEAARLILLNEEGIDFIIEEEEVAKLSPNQTPLHFWDIRMFAIELLQTRSATIEERLIVLGMFLEKLDQLEQSLWSEQLPQLIVRYSDLIQDREQLQLLQSLPNNISFQMDLVRHLLNERIQSRISSQRYIQCLNALINGLQMVEGSTIEQSMNLYKEAYTTYYRPFTEHHMYMLENYLVNYVFKNTFPNNMKQLFEQFTRMIVHFVLVKLHLIGIASNNKKLATDDVLQCIQSFSKTYEHNYQFFSNVLQKLKDANYTTMAHMTILIKS